MHGTDHDCWSHSRLHGRWSAVQAARQTSHMLNPCSHSHTSCLSVTLLPAFLSIAGLDMAMVSAISTWKMTTSGAAVAVRQRGYACLKQSCIQQAARSPRLVAVARGAAREGACLGLSALSIWAPCCTANTRSGAYARENGASLHPVVVVPWSLPSVRTPEFECIFPLHEAAQAHAWADVDVLGQARTLSRVSCWPCNSVNWEVLHAQWPGAS